MPNATAGAALQSPLQMMEVDFSLLGTCMYVLIVLGNFGNVNLMIVVLKHREFQSKCGILVAILAFCDTICLLWETLSATRMITGTTQMHRLTCFWSTVPYIWTMNVGAYMMVAIAGDRLFAIFGALRYRVLRTRNYVTLCCLPGMIYSTVLVSFAISSLDNDPIPACILPLAYPPGATEIWNRGVMFFAAATFFFYLAGYSALTRRAGTVRSYAVKRSKPDSEAKYVREQVKIMRTLGMMMLLFVLSWCVAHSIVFGAEFFSLQTMLALKTYAVLPVLATYTQSYYIYFWRSREYREAFLQLIRKLTENETLAFEDLDHWRMFTNLSGTTTTAPVGVRLEGRSHSRSQW